MHLKVLATCMVVILFLFVKAEYFQQNCVVRDIPFDILGSFIYETIE
jgi:hypothetical protein